MPGSSRENKLRCFESSNQQLGQTPIRISSQRRQENSARCHQEAWMVLARTAEDSSEYRKIGRHLQWEEREKNVSTRTLKACSPTSTALLNQSPNGWKGAMERYKETERLERVCYIISPTTPHFQNFGTGRRVHRILFFFPRCDDGHRSTRRGEGLPKQAGGVCGAAKHHCIVGHPTQNSRHQPSQPSRLTAWGRG